MVRRDLVSSSVLGGGSLEALLLTPTRECLEGTPNISALHSVLQEVEAIRTIDPLFYIKIALVDKSKEVKHQVNALK